MKIEIEAPGDMAYEELNRRLVDHNRDLSSWHRETFTVTAHTADRLLVGGVRGVINMGLVEVRGLWVDATHRGTGLGKRLMSALEIHARTKGARRAALDTYEWQARGFYEARGYTVYGTLSYPDGPERYFMAKDLDPSQ